MRRLIKGSQMTVRLSVAQQVSWSQL